jgi:hypothetical protein
LRDRRASGPQGDEKRRVARALRCGPAMKTLIALSCAALVQTGAVAFAAESCESTADIVAPATSEVGFYDLKCNPQFDRGAAYITKQIVIQRGSGSGVVLDCNYGTLDGGPGKPNAGNDMIVVRSRESEGVWSRPTDVTIRNCNIIGSVRIYGMGGNGQADAIRTSSRQDSGHVARLRAAAPTRILLDNVTITGTGRNPLYVSPGVTYVTLINSEIKGNATHTALYLDAESAYNTIRNNSIHANVFREWHGFNILGPQISIDTSSYNKIMNNRFSGLTGRGIETFRNCGEGGTVRHGSPSYNQIINNVFYYLNSDGDHASVKLGTRGNWIYDNPLGIGNCDEDDGYPWGSSASNYPHSRYNVVMQNQVYKFSPDKMFIAGDSSNQPNYIDHNQTVSSDIVRSAGCYVSNGYKNFILHGQTIDVFRGTNGIPRCTGYRATCNDGELSYQSTSSCTLQTVPYDCSVSGSNTGCSEAPACPIGTRIAGITAACNLESGSVTDAQLASVPGNTIDVVRASDNVSDGRCWVYNTSVSSGEATIEDVLDRRSTPVGCRESDSNGGDCQIRGNLYCR